MNLQDLLVKEFNSIVERNSNPTMWLDDKIKYLIKKLNEDERANKYERNVIHNFVFTKLALHECDYSDYRDFKSWDKFYNEELKYIIIDQLDYYDRNLTSPERNAEPYRF